MTTEAESWPDQEPSQILTDEQLLEKYRDPDDEEDMRIERMIRREWQADKAEQNESSETHFL